MSRRKTANSKEPGSVDSGASSLTVVPPEFHLPSASVQSSGSSIDQLSMAVGRFSSSSNSIDQSRIKRSVTSLFSDRHDDTMQSPFSKRQQTRQGNQTLLVTSRPASKRNLPPASLLRPPRGNLICSTKDLNKEMFFMRALPRNERLSLAARLMRTLEPNNATHSEIAVAIASIASL
jgi:hypothetical protein